MDIHKPKYWPNWRIVLTNFVVVLGVGLLPGAPVYADEAASEIDAFMKEYDGLWNAGNMEAISSRIYRFDVGAPRATPDGLKRYFSDLKVQGFDHTVYHGIQTCLLAKDAALAVQRYTRFNTDGSVMPPAERQTIYMIDRISGGWRITKTSMADASARITCTSYRP